MDRSLELEIVRVTEAAAISSAKWIGKGKKNDADEAATVAMRRTFDTVALYWRKARYGEWTESGHCG